MKNKRIWFALAAGAAAAGIAAFLMGTGKGKKISGKIKSRAGAIPKEIEEVINEAKAKFKTVREELVNDYAKKKGAGVL